KLCRWWQLFTLWVNRLAQSMWMYHEWGRLGLEGWGGWEGGGCRWLALIAVAFTARMDYNDPLSGLKQTPITTIGSLAGRCLQLSSSLCDTLLLLQCVCMWVCACVRVCLCVFGSVRTHC